MFATLTAFSSVEQGRGLREMWAAGEQELALLLLAAQLGEHHVPIGGAARVQLR